jgi:hypothetical protein
LSNIAGILGNSDKKTDKRRLARVNVSLGRPRVPSPVAKDVTTMIASPARIAANRRNAEKSTGPKTLEGKARSRANSLTHGLSAKVLRTPEEVEVLGEPPEKPGGPLGSSPLDRAWIAEEIDLLSFRVRRAGMMEMRLRDRSARRASTCWEMDRRSAAEAMGSKIHRNPAEIASRLEETSQGCRWMIERWAMLARAADRDAGWDPAMHSLAFDLLGTPLDLRKGDSTESIDTEGKVIGRVGNLADFARRNIARLELLEEKLAELDDFDRSTAEAGLAEDLGDAGRRLQRHEAALQRRLRWCVELLEECDLSGDPARIDEFATPEPPPAEEPDEEEIEAEDPDTTLALPPLNRRDRRAIRAERRRDAANRKLARRLE